jgi:hypothetical protein
MTQHVRGSSLANRTLLARVFSLFGPGELPALHVADPTVLDIALCALRREEVTALTMHADLEQPDNSVDAHKTDAMESLRVLGWPTWFPYNSEKMVVFLERHASTLKELECPAFSPSAACLQAVAGCTQLESLTYARRFAPSAWLDLTHLHTLSSIVVVDLNAVSVAAIASALPRLRILRVSMTRRATPPAAAVAGFFECLLPRLRVFHYFGPWPKDDPAITEPSRSLPLLRELLWDCTDFVGGFDEARPTMLGAPCSKVIASWLHVSHTSHGTYDRTPLACVRDLRSYASLPDPTDVVRMLRAAPELRKLDVGISAWPKLGWCNEPAFVGLAHPSLRSIRGSCVSAHLGAEYEQLRRHHFRACGNSCLSAWSREMNLHRN